MTTNKQQTLENKLEEQDLILKCSICHKDARCFKKYKKDLIPVILQEWIESEMGWGIRPDGYSLHRDEESRKKYIENYWKKMPDKAPETYSRPYNGPTIAYVDKNTYNRLKNENGISINNLA